MVDHDRLNVVSLGLKLDTASCSSSAVNSSGPLASGSNRRLCGTTARRDDGTIVLPRPVQAPIILADQPSLIATALSPTSG